MLLKIKDFEQYGLTVWFGCRVGQVGMHISREYLASNIESLKPARRGGNGFAVGWSQVIFQPVESTYSILRRGGARWGGEERGGEGSEYEKMRREAASMRWTCLRYLTYLPNHLPPSMR